MGGRLAAACPCSQRSTGDFVKRARHRRRTSLRAHDVPQEQRVGASAVANRGKFADGNGRQRGAEQLGWMVSGSVLVMGVANQRFALCKRCTVHRSHLGVGG
jgi:hypothetical protein